VSFTVIDRHLVREGAHGVVQLDYLPQHGLWSVLAISNGAGAYLYRGPSLRAAVQTGNRALDHRICSGWRIITPRPYLRHEQIARLADELRAVGDPTLALSEMLFR